MVVAADRPHGLLSAGVFLLILWIWTPSAVFAQSVFVNEVADGSANQVGSYTSLVLDAQGKPHVSYQDITTGDLKYARKSGGVWTTEIADGSASNVGAYGSLALDAQGNPHVSYQDQTTNDLKYARKSGGVWTTETADGSANLVGYYTSLALDAQGNPHVSYEDITTGDLKYARKLGGVWTTETADGSANNVGYYTSLALDAQGNPHVSYQDGTTADLKYARKAGGVWTTEIADGSASAAGYYTSLALDPQGNPHVSYLDGTTFDLKYARKLGGVWTTETADASANNVGTDTALALDAQGNPHVSYLDPTTFDLKYARKSGGVWTTETADGSANLVGQYTSLVLDAQGNPHVSYLDNTTGDLKYADAAVHLLSPAPGITWAVGSRQDIVWTGIGPIDILVSADGGTTYQRLESAITQSPYPIRVSHLPSRFARIRIERASPFSYSATDSFFTINATIALAKFDAMRDDDGTRLTWETRPGPEADIRYRVERASNGAAFASIADGLDRGEFIDPSLSAASRYRLIAINGLGEEYALGETSVAGVLASGSDLSIQPNPAAGGAATFLFRAPFDATSGGASMSRVEVSVFDLSGRRITTLAEGQRASGVHTATWDGRDDAGHDVAAGVYFARLSWNSVARATERVTVVR